MALSLLSYTAYGLILVMLLLNDGFGDLDLFLDLFVWKLAKVQMYQLLQH